MYKARSPEYIRIYKSVVIMYSFFDIKCTYRAQSKKTHDFVECYVLSFSLGQAHASAYRWSLAVSSTTISYSVYVVILGVCLRFKPHWMFQIYKCVIKGGEELTSCLSLIHSHMFLDVLYKQVGNLSFGQ